ncbi:MAG TPA: hypothetical protein PL130_06975 [Dictyoglomaceae bacterium]|nr:hypothetical protein [Dictyoglomaceae bacterium]
MTKFYFIANGPGEISGWLYPLVQWIKIFNPPWAEDMEFCLILNKCQFASGQEEKVVKSWNFFKEIVPPDDYWEKFKSKPNEETIVFHIGGDLFFNLLLAKRWNGISLAYVEKEFWAERFYRRVYSNKPLKPSNSLCVGDLRFDFLPENSFSIDSKKIALFPGSRAYGLRFYLPFYVALVREITKSFPDLSFTVFFSPFLDPNEKNNILSKLEPIWRNLPIEMKELNDMGEIKDYLFAITLPGTNTLQLSYMKIPILVILPLHRPEFLPLEGLGNLVKGRFRDYIINLYLAKNPYLALPNKIKPGIVPEIVGKFKFEDVLKYFRSLLENRDEIENIHKNLLLSFNKDYLSSQLIWEDINEILKEVI